MFITALNCMDGRTIEPIIQYFKNKLNIKDLYVDMITEPGMDKFLKDKDNLKNLKMKVKISLINHFSNYIVVAGHYDCAGNPVSYDQHKEDIIESVYEVYYLLVNELSQDLKDRKITIIGVYVNDSWKIEEVIELTIN